MIYIEYYYSNYLIDNYLLFFFNFEILLLFLTSNFLTFFNLILSQLLQDYLSISLVAVEEEIGYRILFASISKFEFSAGILFTYFFKIDV